MKESRGTLAIMACSSGVPLARKIVNELNKLFSSNNFYNIHLTNSQEIHFANTEIKTVIDDSVRGADLFIIQDVENSTDSLSVDQRLRALKTALDAARRADAKHITAVLPTFPYSRQDKQDGRECITAAQVAQELENAGADRVITLDVHNTAIAGYFRVAKFEDLHFSKDLLDYVRRNIPLDNMVVVSPDAGGAKRANYFAQALGLKLAVSYKERDYSRPSTVENITLLGDVSDKDAFIVDDMISTGGTLYSICKMLKEKYGTKDIYLACSLPLFNPPAKERFDELFSKNYVKQVIGTDAVYHGEDFKEKNPWFKEVSIAPYFAKVIFNINTCRSLSKLL